MSEERRRSIGRAAVAAILITIVAAIAIFCTRQIPENPIDSPGAQIDSPTMYVSSEGTEGDADDPSGEESEEDESDDEPQDEQDPEEEDAASEEVSTASSEDGVEASSGDAADGSGTASRTDGSSSGDAGSTGTGAVVVGGGEGTNPQEEDEVTDYGISTNLGEYTAISTGTKSPNLYGFSYSSRSGFDQDTNLLWFYAMPNSYTPDGYTVRVEYSNELTGSEMVEAESDDYIYSIELEKTDGFETTVRLTLVTQAGVDTSCVVEYTVVYNGREAPTVSVNLTEGQVILTSEYDLVVSATDCDGNTIYSSNIQVYLDGELQSDHSASSPYTYKIDVSANMTDDETPHVVTVVATDYSSEAVSTTVSYNIVYKLSAFGEEIGEVTFTIDATTVGLGVVDTFTVTLHKDYPFAYDMMLALEENGYEVECTGPSDLDDPESSGWSNYYLARLTSDAFRNQSVPERLWNKILDDKLNLTGISYKNSLGEMDYTSVSGWIYTVNGTSAGQSLGSYNPVDGDEVMLIFEIAGGKEVGYAGAGSNEGALSTYNAIWIGGEEILQYDLVCYQVVEEPTCTSTGLARWVDAVELAYDEANDTDTISKYESFSDVEGGEPNGQYITLEMTDHDWEIDTANCIAPTASKDGIKAYKCSICGETKEEVWEYEGTDVDDGGEDEESSSGE